VRGRYLTVSVVAALATLGIVGAQPQAKTMGSGAFDWAKIEAKPTKVGSARQFFRGPTPTLDELECHATTLNPGESPHPAHQHPDEEIMIIKEGTVEALVNGETKRLGPGSVIFQASNQPHTLRNVGDTPATYHVIRWRSTSTPKPK